MGAKLTQEQIKLIEDSIDEIIEKQMSIRAATQHINSLAVSQGMRTISTTTLKLYIPRILKEVDDNETRLNMFKKILKKNTNSQIPSNKKEEVLSEFPKLLTNDTTIQEISTRHGIPYKTVQRWLEASEYYTEYKKASRFNKGKDEIMRTKIKTSKKRNKEILSERIPKGSEFIAKSEEEQRKLIAIKYNQKNLTGNTQKTSCSLDYINKRIDAIMDFFLQRNEKYKINYSDNLFTKEDVLILLFDKPSLIGSSLEEKIVPTVDFLDSFPGLNPIIVSNIIKRNPAVLDYTIQRTKTNLTILSDFGILDAVISKPLILMDSPKTLYALIQFACERTSNNLSKSSFNSIFLSSSSLTKKYPELTFDILRNKYKLPDKYIKILGDKRTEKTKVGAEPYDNQ